MLRHYAYRQLPTCERCGHHDHDRVVIPYRVVLAALETHP